MVAKFQRHKIEAPGVRKKAFQGRVQETHVLRIWRPKASQTGHYKRVT